VSRNYEVFYEEIYDRAIVAFRLFTCKLKAKLNPSTAKSELSSHLLCLKRQRLHRSSGIAKIAIVGAREQKHAWVLPSLCHLQAEPFW